MMSLFSLSVPEKCAFILFRISERMSCEELATFFANLADIPYIRQNHSTFELVATKNKKVISNESYL